MVKNDFTLILHSPYVALDLSMPIAKKPTKPVRRSQTPSISSGRLLEMHSNMIEEAVKLIKHKRFPYPGFILPVGLSSARWLADSYFASDSGCLESVSAQAASWGFQ